MSGRVPETGPMRILVVNGPNLNLIGTRRPDVYGTTTLEELEAMCRHWGADLGASVVTYQSNHEGAIIDPKHHHLIFGIDENIFAFSILTSFWAAATLSLKKHGGAGLAI